MRTRSRARIQKEDKEWEDIELEEKKDDVDDDVSTEGLEIKLPKSLKCVGTSDGVFKKVHIQNLKERETKVKEYSFDKFYKNHFSIKKKELLYGEYNIESNYSSDEVPSNLMGCLMTAFSNHADVLLSPDDVWITILQGFSQHVNFNAEKLRNFFVNHKGKKSLTISTKLTGNKINWKQVLEGFQEEVIKNTKGNYAKNVINDFSTSLPLDVKVSQIAIMTSMKKYFEFNFNFPVCGIRNVHFKGTLKDWENLRQKVEFLSQYGCKDWIKRLLVVIDEFISTYQGKVNKKFWNNVVGWTDGTISRGCKNRDERDERDLRDEKYILKNYYISGWILNFYPYKKNGDSIKQGNLIKPKDLPDVTFKVPVKYRPDEFKTYNLTFLAGFSGINYEDGVYRPQLSFCIANNKELFDESGK